MLGWRKRNDGFEWREYVRTTILLRRRNRRERVERAAQAAVDGLKVAGERGAAAGAVGAQALGRGAKVAGRQGIAMGVAGVRAADGKIRAGLPVVWEALQALGRRIHTALGVLWAVLRAVSLRLAAMLAPVLAAGWRGLEPAFPGLRKPSISASLAVVAAVALVGSVRRIAANGFDRDIFIALLIGSVIVGALLAAWLSEGAPEWLAAALRSAGRRLGRLASGMRKFAPSSASALRGAGVVAVLAIVVGAGWLVWRAAAALPSLVGLTDEAAAIEGRAAALTGDMLRIARTAVRMSGIEAPVDGQTCVSANTRRWRCDQSAKAALSNLLRRGRVTCELSGSDERGNRIGTCRTGETDIAAELVRSGHVFAASGLFASYGSLEREAREMKLGLWNGEPERPSDYRAQKWEEAKREAPDGCPIKGHVRGGRRVYVLPWSRGYERVRISRSRGERWFCSEADAQAAGWKSSEQS